MYIQDNVLVTNVPSSTWYQNSAAQNKLHTCMQLSSQYKICCGMAGGSTPLQNMCLLNLYFKCLTYRSSQLTTIGTLGTPKSNLGDWVWNNPDMFYHAIDTFHQPDQFLAHTPYSFWFMTTNISWNIGPSWVTKSIMCYYFKIKWSKSVDY